MITNESLLVAKYFISWYKIRKNIFKLNRLVGLIFRNIEFWRPIRAEGRQHLTEYQMALKMVSKRPQRILMNLQLLFESVLLAIFVTNSTFTLFVTKVANRTDWNSNCKFIKIRCGHFDTILRSIRYLVKFGQPSARIGCKNSIFPKIKPTNLLSF